MTPITIDGHVVEVEYDANGNIVTLIVPEIVDPNTGQPLTITFMPGVTLSIVTTLVHEIFG